MAYVGTLRVQGKPDFIHQYQKNATCSLYDNYLTRFKHSFAFGLAVPVVTGAMGLNQILAFQC